MKDLKTINVAKFENIASLADIKPFAMKPGGSNAGYIGVKDNQLYMVKIMHCGYANTYIGNNQAEASQIESFTAQFIRSVWGPQFATDIRLAKLPGLPNSHYYFFQTEVDPTLIKQYDLQNKLRSLENKEYSCKADCPYAVVVPYDYLASEFDFNEFMQNSNSENITTKLQNIIIIETIVKLLTIEDHKDANLLFSNNVVKIIDCVAKFLTSCINLYGKDFSNRTEQCKVNPDSELGKTTIQWVLKKFVNFTSQQLEDLIYAYEDTLSTATVEQIRTNIKALQSYITEKYQIVRNDLKETTYSRLSQSGVVSLLSSSKNKFPSDFDVLENLNKPDHELKEAEKKVKEDAYPPSSDEKINFLNI